MIKGIKKAEMECEERAHKLKSQLIELVLSYGKCWAEYGVYSSSLMYSENVIREALEKLYKAEENIMKYIGILRVD